MFSNLVNAKSLRIPILTTSEYNLHQNSETYTRYYGVFLNYIAKINNWEYRKIPTKTKHFLKAAKEGNIDLLYNVAYSKELENGGLYYSKAPSGVNFIMLVSASDDDRFSTSLTNLNNLKIGYSADFSSEKDILEDFIKEKKIKATICKYESIEDLITACRNKEIDLYVTERSTPDYNEKVIYNFSKRRVYFASYHKEIIEKIDYAMALLEKYDDFYKTSIFKKAVNFPNMDFENLTEEEINFIKNKKNINVYIEAAANERNLIEIQRNYWEKISSICGLNFTIKNLEESTIIDSKEYIAEYISNTPTTIQHNIAYTDSIFNLGIRVICKKGFPIENLKKQQNSQSNITEKKVYKIATTIEMLKVVPFFENFFLPFETVIVSNVPECLSMVDKGICDAGILDDFALKHKYSISDYKNLKYQLPEYFIVPIRLKIYMENADLMASILEKTLQQLPLNYISDLQ
ncbi:MAG: transporter substrate-binding domain-containing protein, partial [Treponema sp.]|nr:transporter substrate-binding domain-containing protein [Treponema sp.]